jgi:2-dehydro-3-deoxyphosphogluconate aldolase/(4S)-4-hydroxy-2-oxoglutarate aldolase
MTMLTHEGSIRTIAPTRIMPVAVVHELSQAAPLREALKAGGIKSIEVTLRTPRALEIIQIMSEDPDFLVGAGTVLTAKDVTAALSCGAQFIVSPGLNVSLVDECDRLGIPFFPGVATPTEIMRARDLGFNELKFFPAEALGGASTLKALVAPFQEMKFIPTGGINLENIKSYLAIPQVLAVGGSWIVAEKFLHPGGYEVVTQLTQEALATLSEIQND